MLQESNNKATGNELTFVSCYYILWELCMILNCLLNSLRLNADIPLRGGCGTVLKEPLHQRYVKAVFVVDFRCVPLAEAVGTDTLVP